MKILGMGNALVDVLTKLNSDSLLDELNLPKGSMQLIDADRRKDIVRKTKDLPQVMTAGGCASNTLAALAKLGSHTGFIGKVGNDEYGDLYKSDIQSLGINNHLIYKEDTSGAALVLISPDGERTFGTYLGASADLSVADLSPEIFQGYDCFYVEGYLVQNYELIETAMQMARNQGLKVAIDTASYNVVEANRDFFVRLIDQYVDIIFANEEEAKALTGLPTEEALCTLAGKVEIAVVKTGRKGALAMQGEQQVAVPARTVSVLDATAAGDYYAAGFMYGLSQGKSLATCAHLGTLLASNIIEVVGTRLSDVTWTQIAQEAEKILSSQH